MISHKRLVRTCWSEMQTYHVRGYQEARDPLPVPSPEETRQLYGLVWQVMQDGEGDYYREHANLGMCVRCFHNCIDYVRDNIGVFQLEGAIAADPKDAPNIAWDRCKREGYEMCETRESCGYEDLSDFSD